MNSQDGPQPAEEPGAELAWREAGPARRAQLRTALQLEYLTVSWNVFEGVVAVTAALAAGSVALLAFGIDSFVEVSSGLILVWRLRAEEGMTDRDAVERLDRRAQKLVAISLFALAAYVAFDALVSLLERAEPQPTLVGLVLTAVSLAVMAWLARAKRRAARALGSLALESDAFQTSACWWLSAVALAGIGLNATMGLWWADPAAALGMTFFIARDGREAWRGEASSAGQPSRGT